MLNVWEEAGVYNNREYVSESFAMKSTASYIIPQEPSTLKKKAVSKIIFQDRVGNYSIMILM